ncbi:MAG: Ig-like domain-containing protein [Gemmatimonadales bacterium]
MSASTRAALLALLALGASGAGPLAAQTVAEVQLTPETMTLGVGQKQTVFAAAFDRQGNLISNARFTFRSSDTTIARVEPDGVVVGLAPGLARVEARAQTRRGSLAVLVTGADGPAGTAARATERPAGVTLTLEPAALRLLPGESGRLVPQALRDDGNAVEPGTVTWKSLRADVASVDSTGIVSGVADGRTIIQAAAANGLMATAPIEVEAAEVVLSRSRIVLPPDALDTLQVIVPSQGDRVPAAGASWSSTDSTVARVGPTGIVQGLRPGKAEIVASGFRQERRAAIVVHPVPSAVILSPRPGTDPILIPLGETRRFAAVAQAEDSTPIPEVRIQWEIGDTALAAYDPAAAQLTGRALGTSSLTARVAGFQPASWAFTVVPNRLRLDHTRIGLSPGGRTVVAASLLDDDDKVVGPAAELAWTSDRPDVATVDASGTISGVRIGRAVVTAATPWGASARLDVFVTGDLVLASNRRGGVGIWQARLAAPDTLIPILVDSATNTQPAVSPDRTRIAFSSNRGERDGNFELYVMDADGGGIRRLTTERGTDGEPAWTPDGLGIVFTSARQGAPQLYVIPADSGEARPLTSAPGGNQSAAVSADGRTVAFVSLRDGGPRVYRIGIDGTGEARAGAGALKEGAPAFLPGGELLYGLERSRNSREWRVVRAAPGAPPIPLFDTEHRLVELSSSRDGERVLYVTARGNRPDYRVFLRRLAPPAAAVQLRSRQGEQVSSATF